MADHQFARVMGEMGVGRKMERLISGQAPDGINYRNINYIRGMCEICNRVVAREGVAFGRGVEDKGIAATPSGQSILAQAPTSTSPPRPPDRASSPLKLSRPSRLPTRPRR